jgi:hypothetical protein
VFTSPTAAALGLLFENPLKSKLCNSSKLGREIRGSVFVIHPVPASSTLVSRTHMFAEGESVEITNVHAVFMEVAENMLG